MNDIAITPKSLYNFTRSELFRLFLSIWDKPLYMKESKLSLLRRAEGAMAPLFIPLNHQTALFAVFHYDLPIIVIQPITLPLPLINFS